MKAQKTNFKLFIQCLFLSFSIIISLTNCERKTSEEENNNSFDIIVYGGTPGGIMAAVAAAREGKKTLLIEQTKHVGGLNSSGLNTAESEHMIDESITGYTLDFYKRLGKEYKAEDFNFSPRLKKIFKKTGAAFAFESHVIEKVFLDILKEAGVKIKYEEYVKEVNKTDAKIESIITTNGNKYSGKVFIDCSYEGDLMARANISYTYGRESQDKYDESLAGIRYMDDTLKAKTVDKNGKLLPYFTPEDKVGKPGSGDKRVICYNYRPTMTKVDSNKVPIKKPKNYNPGQFSYLGDYLQNYPDTKSGELIAIYERMHGKYAFNNQQDAYISLGLFGGNVNYPDGSYKKRRKIRKKHKSYTLNYLYYLSNNDSVPKHIREDMQKWGFAKNEFQDNNHFPYYLYIREARRMQGNFIGTQKDIFKNRTKKDAITLGSHWVDAHHVQRVALSDTTFINEGRIWEPVKKPYELSYRIMQPKKKECSNLLVPVCASVSHVAFCSIRVEATWMQLGHAAGVAASHAINENSSVQEININKLQNKLKNQGMVVKADNVKMKDFIKPDF